MYGIGKRTRDFCTTIRNRTRGFFRYRIHTLTTANKRFACYRPSCALKVVSRCSRGNFYVAIPATITTIRGDFRRNTSSSLNAMRIVMPRFIRGVCSYFVVTLRATLNGVTLARTRRQDGIIIFIVMYERRILDAHVSATRAGKFRFSAYRTRTVARFHAFAVGMRNLFLHVLTGSTYSPMPVFVLFKRFTVCVLVRGFRRFFGQQVFYNLIPTTDKPKRRKKARYDRAKQYEYSPYYPFHNNSSFVLLLYALISPIRTRLYYHTMIILLSGNFVKRFA